MRRIVVVCFASAIASAFAACGSDSNHRAEQEEHAGDAGRSSAGAADPTPSDGGAPSAGAPSGEGGTPVDAAGGVKATLGGDSGAAGQLHAGGAGTCDTFEDLLAARALCSSVRDCYPDLQQVERSCVAPGDGDTIDSYAYFDFAYYPNLQAIRTCLCALTDPGPARAWVDCTLAAEPSAATCFDACPDVGNGCADPYGAASQTCNDQNHLGFVAVANCLVAE